MDGTNVKNDHLVTEAATYPTYNKHNGKISIPSARFESVIPEIKRLQTYALNHTDIQVCRVTYTVEVFTPYLMLECQISLLKIIQNFESQIQYFIKPFELC